MDDQGVTDEHRGRYGHGSLAIDLADDPQTIPVVGVNGGPLPVEHGAPVRLRVETQLDSTTATWRTGIEFVEDLSSVGRGREAGGRRSSSPGGAQSPGTGVSVPAR